MKDIQLAARVLGKKGGQSGTGKSKSRSTEVARAAAYAKWNNPIVVKHRFWIKVSKKGPYECWPWTASTDGGGYGRFRYKGQNRGSHQMAYQIEHGEYDRSKDVCHSCDNPPCCNPNHLFLGTTKDNISDCVKKGRRASFVGENNPMAMLTKDQVIKARARVSEGCTMATIAREYGVGHHVVRMAVKGINWKHI
jgi:hypothetical protein